MTEVYEDYSLLWDIYDFNQESVDIYGNELRADVYAYMENDESFIMEGFSDMIDNIVASIKKLISAIKDFFLNIFRTIRSFSMGLKDFNTKYADDIAASSPDFEIQGYNFRVLETKAPNMEDFQKIVSTYNASLQDIAKTKLEDIKKENIDFLKDENLDGMRARILGVGGGIKKDDYRAEVRKYYRGSEEPVTVHVTKSLKDELHKNVDKLDTMLKEARTSQDKIISLLNKAEIFFSRKANSYYRGNSPVVATKTFDYDADYKVKMSDDTIASSDDVIVKLNQLVTYKYNQTREFSSAINIALTERTNALKDMFKQTNSIIRKSVNPKYKDKKEEEKTAVTDGMLFEVRDYMALAAEASLILQDQDIMEQKRVLDAEFKWVIESLEAGKFQDQVVMEGAVRDLVDAVAKFLQNVLSVFRKKATEQSAKYQVWFKEDGLLDAMKKNAETKDLELVPHWDGKYQADLTKLSALLKSVVRKTTNYTNVNWAKQFISANNIEDLGKMSSSERSAKLKNYFRCGKKDQMEVKPVSVAGKSLAGKIDTMFNYCMNYGTIGNSVGRLSNDAKNLKSPVAESVDVTEYSQIFECLMENTDIALMEAGVKPETTAKVLSAKASGDIHGVEAIQKNAQNAQNSVNAQKKDGTKAKEVVDNSNEEVKDGQGETKTPDNSEAQNYYKVSIKFAQDAISAFLTTLEERYFAYQKVLFICASDDWAPVFDKSSGAYIGVKVKTNKTSGNSSGKKSTGKKSNDQNADAKKAATVTGESYEIEKPTKGMTLFW